MSAPRITVIIATFNRAHLLKRAIERVQAQTYRDFVICVYDNASTDATRNVVEQLAESDPRIRYHRHESNIGGAANFLFGLRRVETPLFYFLSDDDVVLPKFFETAVSWLDRYPEARFAAGGTLEMSDTGSLLFAPQAYWKNDGYYVPPEGLDLMLTGFHPSWNTMIFRRRVLDEIGEFNAAIPNVSDVDFTFRVACRYPYVVFREPSGIFVRHESSGGEFADTSIVEQYERMMEGLLSAPDIEPAVKALIRRRLSTQLCKRIVQIGIKQLLRNRPEEARKTLAFYHRRYPRTLLSNAVAAGAAAAARAPFLLAALKPLESLRKSVRSRMSRAAAQSSGAGEIDAARYASYLK